MNTVLKSLSRFGSLNAQYLINKSRNAVRFESQNTLWDFEEVNYQSVAFSKGLASLAFQRNDNFLLRVPAAQQAESYIAKLGTAGINANLIVSHAHTEQEVEQEIISNNIKGIIFEPTLPLKKEQYIDVLNNLIPELANTPNGARVKSAKFPSLSALIQTNFYSYPGVFKFRSILNYAEDKYYQLSSSSDFEAIALPQSDHPIIVTQPAHEFAFRAGVLNSNLNGRFLVVAESHSVSKVARALGGNVDLIATEQIFELDPSINLFVAKGSELHKNHQNRTEL